MEKRVPSYYESKQRAKPSRLRPGILSRAQPLGSPISEPEENQLVVVANVEADDGTQRILDSLRRVATSIRREEPAEPQTCEAVTVAVPVESSSCYTGQEYESAIQTSAVRITDLADILRRAENENKELKIKQVQLTRTLQKQKQEYDEKLLVYLEAIGELENQVERLKSDSSVVVSSSNKANQS